mmetsp:Transcript_22228/g.56506  ORF Transcript_22228/g.56506 Transcript_22228/m.56506 type:complete len:226 (+) Transcript_22228:420-1097(+)
MTNVVGHSALLATSITRLPSPCMRRPMSASPSCSAAGRSASASVRSSMATTRSSTASTLSLTQLSVSRMLFSASSSCAAVLPPLRKECITTSSMAARLRGSTCSMVLSSAPACCTSRDDFLLSSSSPSTLSTTACSRPATPRSPSAPGCAYTSPFHSGLRSASSRRWVTIWYSTHPSAQMSMDVALCSRSLRSSATAISGAQISSVVLPIHPSLAVRVLSKSTSR